MKRVIPLAAALALLLALPMSTAVVADDGSAGQGPGFTIPIALEEGRPQPQLYTPPPPSSPSSSGSSSSGTSSPGSSSGTSSPGSASGTSSPGSTSTSPPDSTSTSSTASSSTSSPADEGSPCGPEPAYTMTHMLTITVPQCNEATGKWEDVPTCRLVADRSGNRHIECHPDAENQWTNG